jgi:hypothetical protein
LLECLFDLAYDVTKLLHGQFCRHRFHDALGQLRKFGLHVEPDGNPYILAHDLLPVFKPYWPWLRDRYYSLSGFKASAICSKKTSATGRAVIFTVDA